MRKVNTSHCLLWIGQSEVVPGTHRRGFTLVELLVVIAVIAILASLLLPTLTQAKRAAASAKCKSNLRQISLAQSMYVGDFSAYPLAVEQEASGLIRSSWPGVLESYIQSSPTGAIFRCPGIRRDANLVISKILSAGHRDGIGHYDLNMAGTAQSSEANFGISHSASTPDPRRLVFRPVLESEVRSPANMIAFGDSVLIGTALPVISFLKFSDFHNPIAGGRGREEDAKMQSRRHNGRFQITFCDGHIEALKTNILFGLNDESARRWNRDNEPHLGVWLGE